MEFTYPDMHFEDGSMVRFRLYNRYYFEVPKAQLEKIGLVEVKRDHLVFNASEKKVHNKLQLILQEGFDRKLIHQLYKKPTFFLREGIPILGSTEIGVVDRGSNIIEIKPLTGCNFTCTYCSVEEGKNRKTHDYLVDVDYLVEVAATVAARKKHPVEFNIGPHGEPTMYPKLLELVTRLGKIPNVGVISMNTNGTLLSKPLIDDLAAVGMTRFNMSIPALDPQLAAELAGVKKFPLEHLLEMIAYAQGKIAVLLAPVLIPGKNEQEMKKIVELGKTIKSDFPKVGIQNFLNYKKGRNPVKQQDWAKFFDFIENLEKETDTSLTSTKEDFRIHEEVELPKPFKKGQTIEALVVMPGRYPNEMYAMAEDRLINVLMTNTQENIGKNIRMKIVRDKHSIYKAVPTSMKYSGEAAIFGKVETVGDPV